MSNFVIAPWLRYECVGCGLCCRRGFNIWCPESEKARLEKVDWVGADPRLAEGRLFVPQSRGYRLAVDESGRCRFLDDDEKCIMHKRIGYDAKLLTCKMYPLNLVHSFGRVHVGLLFSCPAVVEGKGDLLTGQEPLLRKLQKEMDSLFPPPQFAEDTTFDGNTTIAFADLAMLEGKLIDALGDSSMPLVRRVVYAGDLLDRLEKLDPQYFSPMSFSDLLEHHSGKAKEHALNCGLSRKELVFFERVLLRLMQGMCTSLEEIGLISESFWRRQGARAKRIALAVRYLWGAGNAPVGEESVDFEKIRAVKSSRLSEESEGLIARYLRTRLAARSYFGKEGWGVAPLYGARALLTLAPMVVWHAKALAAVAGRSEVAHEDVKAAVMLVDHTFGHTSTLSAAPVRKALQAVNRAEWPQKAFLATVY